MRERLHRRTPCPPLCNRCCECGRYVGDAFTGYTQDKFSNRGSLFCEPCLAAELLRRAAP